MSFFGEHSNLSQLPVRGHARERLVDVEAGTRLAPSPIQHIPYIVGTKDSVERGFHGHRSNSQYARSEPVPRILETALVQ